MILQFITEEELEALPHDQPTVAFARLVKIAQSRFLEQIQHFENGSDATDYRYDFQSAAITAAERYGIRAIADLEMPAPDNYQYGDFRRFEVGLNKVIAGLVIEGAQRPRWNSVFIPQRSKTLVLHRVEALRKAIRDDMSIDQKVKERLLNSLDGFEKSLSKRRFELVHLMMLSMTVATVPGGIADTVHAVEDITQIIQQAYAEEQEREEPSQLQIAGQPSTTALLNAPLRPAAPAFQSGSMDDDIPF